MKAFVFDKYGGPEVLKFAEVEKPAPAAQEVLIRVHASSVNPLDWHNMRGEPYFMRMSSGLSAPKNPRMGTDLAGTVEAVGSEVSEFKPGDEVFGSRNGAFGEYVTTQGKALAHKPSNLSFEQAAAMPIAGLTALQGLRDHGSLQPGQKVLINGAAGGVGTFAVQIAKALGAEVTGVCSTQNVSMVQSIGADRVIDYTREDFTRGQERYDLIFDCVGNHLFTACLRVMTPKGTFVVVGGKAGRWLEPMPRMLHAKMMSPIVSQTMTGFMAALTREDLLALKELAEAGKVTPVIDRTYKLEEVPEAIGYLETGHARGKVIIKVL